MRAILNNTFGRPQKCIQFSDVGQGDSFFSFLSYAISCEKTFENAYTRAIQLFLAIISIHLFSRTFDVLRQKFTYLPSYIITERESVEAERWLKFAGWLCRAFYLIVRYERTNEVDLGNNIYCTLSVIIIRLIDWKKISEMIPKVSITCQFYKSMFTSKVDWVFLWEHLLGKWIKWKSSRES